MEQYKKIEHGFDISYHLAKDSRIFNVKTQKYVKPASGTHSYKLKTVAGDYKRITLKALYLLVYEKNYCKDEIENLQDEQWKPIERTNSVYWISSCGRVKSLVDYEARLLNPYDIQGYDRVDIYQEGERTSKLVHKLVANAFLEPPKYQDMQVHHKNHNKKDNAVQNLIYVTPAEHKKLHRKEHSNAISSK